MPRIPTISDPTAQTRDQLEAVRKRLGKVPNMMATMAQSPAALDGYLAFSGALGNGALNAKTREQIALTVGQANACDYCLAAHTAIGGMLGLTQDQIVGARSANAGDAKNAATLKLASRIVETRGNVSDADVKAARAAGLTDGELAEVVANVALNIYTNYFNHVAATEVDFPRAAAI